MTQRHNFMPRGNVQLSFEDKQKRALLLPNRLAAILEKTRPDSAGRLKKILLWLDELNLYEDSGCIIPRETIFHILDKHNYARSVSLNDQNMSAQQKCSVVLARIAHLYKNEMCLAPGFVRKLTDTIRKNPQKHIPFKSAANQKTRS